MAPRYPTYQRQVRLNQPIEVPPNIDQAAMREAGKMYGELAQRAEQVKNFAFKRAEQTAISEGTRAGSQNPEQVLAQYGGERPTDIYGQAAFDAANKIGGVQLEAKAREAIGNAYINAKKTKQDPNDLQAGLGAIISGYTSALDDLDPLTAARTRAKLESYARSAFLDRSADAIKEQQKALDGDATFITDNIFEQSQLMGQVATAGGDKEFKAAMAAYKDSMEGLGQTPKSIQANIAKAKNLYHIARVRREFRDAKDKGAFLEKFRKDRKTGKGLARGIDDLRIESLTSSFESDIVQADRLRTAKIRDINSQINDGFDILTKNGSISDKDIDEFRKQAGDVGDAALMKRVDFLERENNELKDLGRGGSRLMLQAADEARVTIEALRNAGKTTPEYLLDKEKRLRKAAEARRKLEERDPMAAAAAAHGAPTMPMLSVADMIRDPQKLKDHIRANLNASGMYDVAPVYMTQDTISKLKVAFEKTSTDFETQAALVSSIQEAAGPLAPRVFAQIASQTEASDLAHVGALMNPEVMEAYFKGRQAIASGTRVDEPLQGSMKNDLNKLLGASMQLKPGLYGDLLATSEAVYLARHAGERYNKDNYENIVHELVGGRFTGKNAVGGLVDYKGRALILPRDFTRDDGAFESAYETITDVSLRSVATERGTPVFRNPLSGEYEEISASRLRKDYNLMPYGAGLYVLTDRAGNHVAAGDIKEADDGTTYYEEQRDPYVLDFSKVIQ